MKRQPKSCPSKFTVVGLYVYCIANLAENGDDLHKKFQFLPAGIQKGNRCEDKTFGWRKTQGILSAESVEVISEGS